MNFELILSMMIYDNSFGLFFLFGYLIIIYLLSDPLPMHLSTPRWPWWKDSVSIVCECQAQETSQISVDSKDAKGLDVLLFHELLYLIKSSLDKVRKFALSSRLCLFLRDYCFVLLNNCVLFVDCHFLSLLIPLLVELCFPNIVYSYVK